MTSLHSEGRRHQIWRRGTLDRDDSVQDRGERGLRATD